jgi:hypothetical protein
VSPTHYKARAQLDFNELRQSRTEDQALAAVAGLYFVSEPTMRQWLNLKPKEEN